MLSARSSWIRGWRRVGQCTKFIGQSCSRIVKHMPQSRQPLRRRCGCPGGIHRGRLEWQADAIAHTAAGPGIRRYFRFHFSAPRTFTAVAVLLGRSWILCAGRPRHSPHPQFHSTLDAFQCAPTAGASMAGALVESHCVQAAGDEGGDVVAGGILSARPFSFSRARD